MPRLTKDEYEKYQQWLHNEEIQKVWNSQDAIYNLEDDIDFPIKNIVAILALAKCEPVFSCCGFDYRGQPYHKSHQYGEPYVMCKLTEVSRYYLGGAISKLPQTWWVQIRGSRIFLERRFALQNPHWTKTSSPHFAEEITDELRQIESQLYFLLSPSFVEEVILEDTNKLNATHNKYWQYIPKNPWVITHESLTI